MDLGKARLGHMFASPVLEHVWEDGPVLNPDLRARILEHERRSLGESRSNIGGWHSETGALEFCGIAGQRLIRHMRDMTQEATARLYAEYGREAEPLNWELSAWANINRRGQANHVHTHPGATWSGVYYVDGGEALPGDQGAAIHLTDPSPTRTNIFFPDLLTAAVRFRPEPGLMILFPSYVPHAVPPHEGDRPRISIAFNVRKDPFP
jgi:uncharacterized protein (TIGR02466 family)